MVLVRIAVEVELDQPELGRYGADVATGSVEVEEEEEEEAEEDDDVEELPVEEAVPAGTLNFAVRFIGALLTTVAMLLSTLGSVDKVVSAAAIWSSVAALERTTHTVTTRLLSFTSVCPAITASTKTLYSVVVNTYINEVCSLVVSIVRRVNMIVILEDRVSTDEGATGGSACTDTAPMIAVLPKVVSKSPTKAGSLKIVAPTEAKSSLVAVDDELTEMVTTSFVSMTY